MSCTYNITFPAPTEIPPRLRKRLPLDELKELFVQTTREYNDTNVKIAYALAHVNIPSENTEEEDEEEDEEEKEDEKEGEEGEEGEEENTDHRPKNHDYNFLYLMGQLTANRYDILEDDLIFKEHFHTGTYGTCSGINLPSVYNDLTSFKPASEPISKYLNDPKALLSENAIVYAIIKLSNFDSRATVVMKIRELLEHENIVLFKGAGILKLIEWIYSAEFSDELAQKLAYREEDGYVDISFNSWFFPYLLLKEVILPVIKEVCNINLTDYSGVRYRHFFVLKEFIQPLAKKLFTNTILYTYKQEIYNHPESHDILFESFMDETCSLGLVSFTDNKCNLIYTHNIDKLMESTALSTYFEVPYLDVNSDDLWDELSDILKELQDIFNNSDLSVMACFCLYMDVIYDTLREGFNHPSLIGLDGVTDFLLNRLSLKRNDILSKLTAFLPE